MHFWVGITDIEWFDFLAREKPEEVNFWQPGGSPFKVLAPGELFLFKLKSPRNCIAGGGFFVKHMRLPLSAAWDAFGVENGTPDWQTLLGKIQHLRRKPGTPAAPNPEIGCIILAHPFFYDRELWIPQPPEFPTNVVQGKTYSTDDEVGRYLWQEVEARLRFNVAQTVEDVGAVVQLAVEPDERYRVGEERHRLGQGAFRALVTDAYGRRCAVTGERTLPVLQASHIKPYAQDGPHDVRNGLLLRSDFHTLFDLGYITVTPDHVLEVSSRVKEEWQNGHEYYAHHGQEIRLPAREIEYPHCEFLEWHNETVYRP